MATNQPNRFIKGTLTMPTIPETGGAGQPYTPPKTSNGQTDWDHIAAESKRDPSLGFHVNHDEKRESEQRTAKIVEDMARMEEAKTERERLKLGLGSAAPTGSRELVGRSLGG